MYFAYDDAAIQYLSKRDKRLGAAIARIGHINREVDSDLFASVVHHIISQQISTSAQATIWKRLHEAVPAVDAENLLALGRDSLQAIGISYRKADYILDFARRVHSGEFDIAALVNLPDEQLIAALTGLKGVGVWTAEMLMTFCLERNDVVSFGDLAILRGMRMLYRHRVIDRQRFKRYRKRYSPYGTVASLYLWAISGGALPELTDPAPGKK